MILAPKVNDLSHVPLFVKPKRSTYVVKQITEINSYKLHGTFETVSKGMFNNNNNKIMIKITVLWQTLLTAGKHCVTVVNSRGHIPEVGQVK